MRSIFGKIKGPLKIYLRWPVYGSVFFAVVNAIMYFIDLRAAVVFSAALLIYLVFLTVFMITKHNFFTRNIIEFASGYAQMQKRMMDDLMVLLLKLSARKTIIRGWHRFSRRWENWILRQDLIR